VLKKKTHCTYAWQHKDVKAQREDHFATFDCHGSQSKTHPNGCNCYVHDSRFCYLCRLLRIERNETVARKDVRFKPETSPESHAQGNLKFWKFDKISTDL